MKRGLDMLGMALEIVRGLFISLSSMVEIYISCKEGRHESNNYNVIKLFRNNACNYLDFMIDT